MNNQYVINKDVALKINDCLQDGRKIEGIKALRNVTGLNLYDAMEIYDNCHKLIQNHSKIVVEDLDGDIFGYVVKYKDKYKSKYESLWTLNKYEATIFIDYESAKRFIDLNDKLELFIYELKCKEIKF
jgi:hypothetical protein